MWMWKKVILFFICIFPLVGSEGKLEEMKQWPPPDLPVWHRGKQGYIDKTGKFVINPQFDGAGDFSEGLARVCIGGSYPPCCGGKWGYIDRTGKILINPQFDYAEDFSEGLAVVDIGAKCLQ